MRELSTLGDTMMLVEGYHDYHWGVQYHGGYNLLLFEYPTVLNTPTVLMIPPHVL